jgi:hypothetical protein
MLRALTFLSIQGPAGWIPILKQNSPQPPFAFAGERIESVPERPTAASPRRYSAPGYVRGSSVL